MPEFEKAADQLKKHDIILAKVNCEEQSALCQRFSVNAYPTLRIFYHGYLYHYEGYRNAEGIVQYMITHLKQQKEKEK